MIKILRYFKWYYWLICLAIVGLIYCQVQLELKLPDYMEDIVGHIMSFGSTKDILGVGLKMLGVSLLATILMIIVGYLSANIAARFAKILRNKIFCKVESFSMTEMNRFSTASLITRSTNDVTQVQNVVMMTLRIAVTAPIMAGTAITKILNRSEDLTKSIAISVLCLVVFIVSLMIIVMPKFKKFQTKVDKLNSVTRENLTGLRVVRAYNAEEYQEEKFDKANTDIAKTELFINRTMGLMHPFMHLVFDSIGLIVWWLGAHLISKGLVDLAVVSAFTGYAMQIVTSFMMITMIFIMIPRGIVSAKRINEILDTENIINDPLNPVQSKGEVKGEIEFKNVSFKYPGADEYVIEDVTFKAKKGEMVAFIGSTGSGKSTLINLIPRFYDATEGEILVDGINVKNYTQYDLHEKLGYVPQKGLLFSGTIRSNMQIGKDDASDEEIARALDIAQATDFVNKLEEKYDYPIAQGGTNVSGGQKQRLCIARAIIKNPEIFIFDDSFSALDYKTDKALRKRLEKETKDATVLVVAQRIGTIMNADKIIVLDEGRMVGMGTHEELLESCDVYREMALSQLSKEELAYGKN